MVDCYNIIKVSQSAPRTHPPPPKSIHLFRLKTIWKHKHFTIWYTVWVPLPSTSYSMCGLCGRIRPLYFRGTLQLHCTLSFSLITLKRTQQASYVSQLSAEKIQIQIIIKVSTTLNCLCKKVCWEAKTLILCEAHCQKFNHCFIYNLKTVESGNKIPTDLS